MGCIAKTFAIRSPAFVRYISAYASVLMNTVGKASMALENFGKNGKFFHKNDKKLQKYVKKLQKVTIFRQNIQIFGRFFSKNDEKTGKFW